MSIAKIESTIHLKCLLSRLYVISDTTISRIETCYFSNNTLYILIRQISTGLNSCNCLGCSKWFLQRAIISISISSSCCAFCRDSIGVSEVGVVTDSLDIQSLGGACGKTCPCVCGFSLGSSISAATIHAHLITSCIGDSIPREGKTVCGLCCTGKVFRSSKGLSRIGSFFNTDIVNKASRRTICCKLHS